MTLVEAFQELAPPTGDLPDEVQTRRHRAAEVLYDALQRVARRALSRQADADELISRTFLRLLSKGPRRPRENDPTTDGQVEGFLYTCLRNQERDQYRRSRGHDSLDDDACGPTVMARLSARADGAGFVNGYDALLAAEGHALVERATAILYEQALPALAGQSRDADSFAQSVRDVRDLARRTISIDIIVARDGLPPGSTSANRLYKRHECARTVMLDRLRQWLDAMHLPPELDDAVRRLAEHDMASRVVRGGPTS